MAMRLRRWTSLGFFGHLLLTLQATAAPLQPRQVATNGMVISTHGNCGENVGMTCSGSKYGESCSKWGFCGTGETFSGEGCLHNYGWCQDSGNPSPTRTITVRPSSSSTPPDHTPKPPKPPKPTSQAADNPTPTTSDAAFIQGPVSAGDAAPTLPGGDTFAMTTSLPPPSPSSHHPFAVVFNNGLPNPVAGGPGFIAENAGLPGDPSPASGSSNPNGSDGPGSQLPGGDPSSSGDQPGASGAPPPKVKYKMFTGDGGDGWPTMDQWYSFDAIWEANLFKINTSCQGFNTINNTPDETAAVKAALLAVAESTGVDKRFVLAVMMQESQGCVRVPTTNYGVSNPGLFQSHAGKGSCNNQGQVLHPCPTSQINQMAQDGVAGTPQGAGLKETIAKAPGSGAAKFYQGARIYNSGSIAPSGDLGQGVATHCYATDVANRLLGWTSKTKNGCTLDSGGGSWQ